MPSVTPFRLPFSLGLPLLRPRPLDAVGRQRVEALLFAGREDAAVKAYREATNAPHRTATQAVAQLKAALTAEA